MLLNYFLEKTLPHFSHKNWTSLQSYFKWILTLSLLLKGISQRWQILLRSHSMLFEFKNIQAFFTLALSTWMLLCELHNEWVLFLDIWVCNFFENTLLLASFAVFRISLARIAYCFWTWEIWALQKINITILALGALQPVVGWMEIIFFNIFRLKSELSF